MENPYQSPLCMQEAVTIQEPTDDRKGKDRYRTNYLLWLILTLPFFFFFSFIVFEVQPDVYDPSKVVFWFLISSGFGWFCQAIVVVAIETVRPFLRRRP